MAVAVVIDATVVRGVLLPAALAVLGERAGPRDLRPAPAGTFDPAAQPLPAAV